MIKTFVTLALLLTAPFAFAGVDLGASTSQTPYDRYMGPVRSVLQDLGGGGADMNKVNALMREGRSFRYSFTRPYLAMPPHVTASTRTGDCKDKALWLCDQIGDPNVRFVVGKARSSSKISHAWVMWQHQGRWWVLDCTNASRPIPADRLSSNEYIPLYSWGKNGTFRHHSGHARMAKIAGKRGEPVAARN